MESIFGKIFASAMMCAVTGGDPEIESRKCADEIISGLKEEITSNKVVAGTASEDTNAERRAEREAFASMVKGTDGFRLCVERRGNDESVETTIIGRGLNVLDGVVILLTSVAKSASDGDKLMAAVIVKSICDSVVHQIISEGGTDDAQN